MGRLAERGISVTGVTKATLGSPEIAATWLQAGVHDLGDSRLPNIEGMRRAGVEAPMSLIRSPMLSQIEEVVALADVSFNTELEVIQQLSIAAGEVDQIHGIVLMVELGDLREGILPRDLHHIVGETLRLPSLALLGIGANLACQSGVEPSPHNMTVLSSLANSIEATFGQPLGLVSGGNSANLDWALGESDSGRINNLRLGEALLLGCEPLHRRPISGLYTDAFTLIAEVIESKLKPSRPWGTIAQTAFGDRPREQDRGDIVQVIVALGHQDTDPGGLDPPPGFSILGASSDHLILDAGQHQPLVGEEISFQLNYSALLRAMTSPFIEKFIGGRMPAQQVH